MVVLLFISSMNLYTFKTGGFRWRCANVLDVSGDSYSERGAKAFRTAAGEAGFGEICPVSYDPVSGKIEDAIKKLSDKCQLCRANVVFANARFLASMFVEVQKQQYKGEWVVADSVLDDNFVSKMTEQLTDKSSVHEVMQGMCELALEKAKASRSQQLPSNAILVDT